MTLKVVILPDAKRDLRKAVDWYDEKQPGLGQQFMQAVDLAIDAVARNPMIYSCGVLASSTRQSADLSLPNLL